ncbi:MAG: acetyltransferase [Herbinix sp.]|jgi:ribosomal protein S18 acetylase RimI-like enzyme|nr:acetyltransferase [Herbinix sp.]
MDNQFVNLTLDNIYEEHLCCAIADKKHQCGVDAKREWLTERIKEGHVFRKLNQKGKVFIEYAPLENAWVPILGDNYVYIYCLWVSGSFKDKGFGRELLEYCIQDSKLQGKSGVCIISSNKKKPFLSDKKYMQKYGFVTVETIDNDYELMALSFDGSIPHFTESVRKQSIESTNLTIYYGSQCPYIPNCIEQIDSYCKANQIPCSLIKVDTLEKSKSVPCVFNNWAVFHKGSFKTLHILNEGYLIKLLEQE